MFGLMTRYQALFGPAAVCSRLARASTSPALLGRCIVFYWRRGKGGAPLRSRAGHGNVVHALIGRFKPRFSGDNLSSNCILLIRRRSFRFVVVHHCVLVGGTFTGRMNRTDRCVFGVVEKNYEFIIRDDDLIFLKDSLGREDFAGIDGSAPTGRVLVVVVLTQGSQQCDVR
jgi:hypothetical protein